MNVQQALAQARELGVDRVDASLLLCDLLCCERGWLITHDDAELTPELSGILLRQIRQRADGVPVAYLLGRKEFHGLDLAVTVDTLVPRPDTETLVDWALELLTPLTGKPSVIDLGTGSGAIALALKHRHPAAQVEALDLSAAALAVAQGNAQRLGLDVTFHQGDWWQPVQDRRYDLIVGNPPYIAADDPHLPALRHEPTQALTPGGDGLSALQAIIAGAPAHLQPGGWLLLEHGYDQAEPVAALLRASGFGDVSLRRDLGGQARVSGGRRA